MNAEVSWLVVDFVVLGTVVVTGEVPVVPVANK